MTTHSQSQTAKVESSAEKTKLKTRDAFAHSATRSAIDPGDRSERSTHSPKVKIEGDILELGVIFDEFELVRYIGGGGMGHVWLAQDCNLNRLVALKVLHTDKVENTEVTRRFRAEAQAVAMLNHPNIVQIYAFREDPASKRMYIAMEYIAGENIRDQVNERGPLPVAKTVVYALQMAHALAHLDELRIVHRDIKPSNILLTPEGDSKLIDFGLARQFSFNPESDAPEDALLQSPANDITASGVTLGTFDYISPEQARDPRTVDIRSDIYSLGCTLYFMLTGHPPFPQGNPLQKLLQHQSDDPLDVRLARNDVPESLCRVLLRAMKKNRDTRYASPDEMIRDLEEVAMEIGLEPEPGSGCVSRTRWISTAPQSVPLFHWETLKRHLFWIAPLLVLAVTLLVLNVVWTPHPEDVAIPTSEELPPALEEIK
ncbi:MAG: serine/threonine-protein kinase [Planctomycetia bacterium]|nr:serine/threonine-protein kinase [Planctomycetia bacterium]